jgi:hypothetical protein
MDRRGTLLEGAEKVSGGGNGVWNLSWGFGNKRSWAGRGGWMGVD